MLLTLDQTVDCCLIFIIFRNEKDLSNDTCVEGSVGAYLYAKNK
jgi:hypothetical protein